MGEKYVYINEFGHTEKVDIETGEIEKVVLSPTDLLNYHPIEVKGKIRFVPLEKTAAQEYTPAIGEAFAYLLLQGTPILETCTKLNVPYHTYCKWRRNIEEFRDIVDEARKDRAEVFFDKIAKTAEETRADEDEIALSRLKIDAYKHIAKVSDSRRFGDKQQITAQVGIARLVVDTGIDRQGRDGSQEEAIYGAISERQNQIAEQELAENIIKVKKPDGMQATEAEKDGLVPVETPDARTNN